MRLLASFALVLGLLALLAFLWTRAGSWQPDATPQAARDASPLTAPAREVVSLREPVRVVEKPEYAGRLAIVMGRLVDGRGDPVGRATVRVAGAACKSSPDGRFRAEVKLARVHGLEHALTTFRAGFLPLEVRVGLRRDADVDLGDLSLRAAGMIAGRVLDAAGAPVKGAEVVGIHPAGALGLDRRIGPLRAMSRAETNARGAFVLSGVPAGEAIACARAEGMIWSVSAALEVPPSGTAEVVLVLEPFSEGDVIELVVLDPGGAPVPFARIESRYVAASVARRSGGIADRAGIYRHFAEADVPHDFSASDPAQRWGSAFVPGVMPGQPRREARLPAVRALDLHVQTPDGLALEEFGYTLTRREGPSWSSSTKHPAVHHPMGVLRILLLAEELEVEVDAPGHELARLGPFLPGWAPARIDVVVRPVPGVRGLVLANGLPLAGATVGLHAVPEGRVLSVAGFRARHEPTAACSATTDEAGGFVLMLREAGTYFLRAEAPGLAPADLGPLRFEAPPQAAGLKLELGRGGTIEGRLLTVPGDSPAGMLVAASRGDGHARTQQCDASGGFRFEELTPGPWLVELWQQAPGYASRPASGSQDERIPWNCVVSEDASTRFDLDLRERWQRTLSGLLSVNGEPARGWRASLRSVAEPSFQAEAKLDREGRFQLALRTAGECILGMAPPEDPAGALEDRIVLAGERTHWELDLPCGSLTVHAPTFAGMELSWQGSESLRFHRSFFAFSAPAPGSITFKTMPAGEITLRSRIPDCDDFVERTVTVSRGSSASVELR